MKIGWGIPELHTKMSVSFFSDQSLLHLIVFEFIMSMVGKHYRWYFYLTSYNKENLVTNKEIQINLKVTFSKSIWNIFYILKSICHFFPRCPYSKVCSNQLGAFPQTAKLQQTRSLSKLNEFSKVVKIHANITLPSSLELELELSPPNINH